MAGSAARLWQTLFTTHPARTTVVSFAAVILGGTLLLTLPVSSADSGATGLVPALFTATSACASPASPWWTRARTGVVSARA